MTRRTKQIEAAKNKDALEELKAILDDSDAELTDLESLEAEPDEEVPSEAEAASDDDEYVGAGYKPTKQEDSEDEEGPGKRTRKSKKQLKWSRKSAVSSAATSVRSYLCLQSPYSVRSLG